MYKIKVNENFDFRIETKQGKTFINGNTFEPDLIIDKDGTYHLIHENLSVNAHLVEIDLDAKSATFRVNQSLYTMSFTDQYDELLHQLGMDKLTSLKVSDLKAPMPGMVLKVLVKEGDEVLKGSNLLILEAMKMENIIKSPADLIIKSLKVHPGDKVEKNQILINFS